MKPQSPLPSSTAGSFSRFSAQSFDTIRQAPSTAATSIGCSDDHRWSEVVPPEAGLTFAVVWDPEEKDILTFSTAQLSEQDCDCDSQSPNSPSDAYDNRSQVLTITPSVVPASEFATTPGTLAFFRENQDFLFAEPASFFPDRSTRGRTQTQTSSTLDGLDVYVRGSMLGKAHNANRYYSCFQDLDGDFAFDPCTSFAHTWMKDTNVKGGGVIRDDISDEGFFEGGHFELGGMDNEEAILSSRFSGTTTSTSNFVNVENMMEDDSSTTWSALEAPNTPSYSRLLFSDPPSSKSRLRKTRPIPGPASPSDVLDRPEYNHNLWLPIAASSGTPDTLRARSPAPRSRSSTPTPPRTRKISRVPSLPKFARGLGRWKKTEEAGWVWVDVKEKPQPRRCVTA
ncbi:hypothetical protein B0H19DRAFT_1266807 [Mycena capillaripes]|nr:hypothetical protein B0H19DRAFT_1266807 [Mycena capillaripes]